ncbi:MULTISPECIES: TetR/AcrR family transcriptional regulator [unclassified Acidisoma]|uniref:TetR/AcrR family transcriptional regulator n=1 Tax=unclassified Acidisoma TaxID=2634065 RepID=UPI0021106614|nr:MULTISPECIES: TetR/AcrR family transcriptional regulator [unclassified Acidisoma]
MNVHSERAAPKDKRRQILDGALALIAEHGFHGSGMAALAKLARVPVGTIYRYFPSKEALIHDLYKEIKEQMMAEILRNFEPAQPIRERFFAIWSNLFDYYRANPQSFIFMEQYASSPFLRELQSTMWETTPQVFKDFFEEGYRDQILKPLPPEILYALMIGPIIALTNANGDAARPISQDIKRDVMVACWDSLKL